MATSTAVPASMATAGMTESSPMTGMPMAFSNENFATILYTSGWMPTTTAGYIGSWLFLFFLALIWRGLIRALSQLDRYWARKHEAYTILYDGGKERVSRERMVGVWRTSVNLPRATLATLNQGIAYLLYGTRAHVA